MDASTLVSAVFIDVPVPVVKWPFVYKVYVMLLNTFFFAMLGLIGWFEFQGMGTGIVWFELQGVGTGINFIAFVLWIRTIDTERWFLRCICIFMASLLFGATIGSLLDHFYNIDQWNIVSLFASSVFLFTHHVLALWTRDFNLIRKINAFALPVFISFFVIPKEPVYMVTIILVVPVIWCVLLWLCRDSVLVWKNCILLHIQWISILSICFMYPFLYLVYIYVFLLFIRYHLITHTQQTIRLSLSYPEGDLSVTGTCISFYTGILERTIYLVIDFARIGLVWVRNSAIMMQIWQASCTYINEIQDGLIAVVTGLKDYLIKLAGGVILVYVSVVCIYVFVTSRLEG